MGRNYNKKKTQVAMYTSLSAALLVAAVSATDYETAKDGAIVTGVSENVCKVALTRSALVTTAVVTQTVKATAAMTNNQVMETACSVKVAAAQYFIFASKAVAKVASGTTTTTGKNIIYSKITAPAAADIKVDKSLFDATALGVSATFPVV